MPLKQTTGSRAQVMHGSVKKTTGGLTKSQLKYNKQGKIVSRKASALAKNNNRLVKAGYITRKGVFGVSKMRGGGDSVEVIPGHYDPRKNENLNSILLRNDGESPLSSHLSDNLIKVYQVTIDDETYTIGVFYRIFEINEKSRKQGFGTKIINYFLNNKFDFILVANILAEAIPFWDKFKKIKDDNLFPRIVELLKDKVVLNYMRLTNPAFLIYGDKYSQRNLQ